MRMGAEEGQQQKSRDLQGEQIPEGTFGEELKGVGVRKGQPSLHPLLPEQDQAQLLQGWLWAPDHPQIIPRAQDQLPGVKTVPKHQEMTPKTSQGLWCLIAAPLR